MNEIRKQKKKKEEKKKKLERAPGQRFGPEPNQACGPTRSRTGTPFFPFLSLTGGA
jgi:hypothetical protein